LPLTGTPCDNGNGCDTGEKCDNGSCGVGTPVNVDDNDACTIDSCVPPSGTILHEPKDCGVNPYVKCFKGACLAAVDCADTDEYTFRLVGSGLTAVRTYKNGLFDGFSSSPAMDASFTCKCADTCAVGVVKLGDSPSSFSVSIDSPKIPNVKMTMSPECFLVEEIQPGQVYAPDVVAKYFGGQVSYVVSYGTGVTLPKECDSFFGPRKKN
jgi:hypothetical protein